LAQGAQKRQNLLEIIQVVAKNSKSANKTTKQEQQVSGEGMEVEDGTQAVKGEQLKTKKGKDEKACKKPTK